MTIKSYTTCTSTYTYFTLVPAAATYYNKKNTGML